MSDHSSRYIRAMSADKRNKHGSENNFILPIIPVQGFHQQFWEQLKFNINLMYSSVKDTWFGNDFISLLHLL